MICECCEKRTALKAGKLCGRCLEGSRLLSYDLVMGVRSRPKATAIVEGRLKVKPKGDAK
jgi:hypothetical protein